MQHKKVIEGTANTIYIAVPEGINKSGFAAQIEALPETEDLPDITVEVVNASSLWPHQYDVKVSRRWIRGG